MNKFKLIFFFIIVYYYKRFIKSITYFTNGFSLLFYNNNVINIFKEEIKYNKINKIFNCCNPKCKLHITDIFYYGYEGYYCSKSCRTYSGKMLNL
jgi:hypothetical protein